VVLFVRTHSYSVCAPAVGGSRKSGLRALPITCARRPEAPANWRLPLPPDIPQITTTGVLDPAVDDPRAVTHPILFSQWGQEAAVGFEPTDNGFANRRLWPLGYAASTPVKFAASLHICGKRFKKIRQGFCCIASPAPYSRGPVPGHACGSSFPGNVKKVEFLPRMGYKRRRGPKYRSRGRLESIGRR
jgi:hypothetical protein